MTKQQILQQHGMDESSFYKRFPTQESYEQYCRGGKIKYGNGGAVRDARNQAKDLNAAQNAVADGGSGSATGMPDVSSLVGMLPDVPNMGKHGTNTIGSSAMKGFKATAAASLNPTTLAATGGLSALVPVATGLIGAGVGLADKGAAQNAVLRDMSHDNAVAEAEQGNYSSSIYGQMASTAPNSLMPPSNFANAKEGVKIDPNVGGLIEGQTHEQGGVPLINQQGVQIGEAEGNGVSVKGGERIIEANASKEIEDLAYSGNFDLLGHRVAMEIFKQDANQGNNYADGGIKVDNDIPQNFAPDGTPISADEANLLSFQQKMKAVQSSGAASYNPNSLDNDGTPINFDPEGNAISTNEAQVLSNMQKFKRLPFNPTEPPPTLNIAQANYGGVPNADAPDYSPFPGSPNYKGSEQKTETPSEAPSGDEYQLKNNYKSDHIANNIMQGLIASSNLLKQHVPPPKPELQTASHYTPNLYAERNEAFAQIDKAAATVRYQSEGSSFGDRLAAHLGAGSITASGKQTAETAIAGKEQDVNMKNTELDNTIKMANVDTMNQYRMNKYNSAGQFAAAKAASLGQNAQAWADSNFNIDMAQAEDNNNAIKFEASMMMDDYQKAMNEYKTVVQNKGTTEDFDTWYNKEWKPSTIGSVFNEHPWMKSIYELVPQNKHRRR